MNFGKIYILKYIYMDILDGSLQAQMLSATKVLRNIGQFYETSIFTFQNTDVCLVHLLMCRIERILKSIFQSDPTCEEKTISE